MVRDISQLSCRVCGFDFGLNCGFHYAGVGEETSEAGCERIQGPRDRLFHSHRWARKLAHGWGTHFFAWLGAGHAEGAGALGIEEQLGELAGEVKVEALRDEDEFAAGGDDDGAFVGGEDLLLSAGGGGRGFLCGEVRL